MKTSIIVGSAGQDGSLLSEQLKGLGHRVIGVTRSTLDILNPSQVQALVAESRPDEIYYLAAFHHAAQDQPLEPALLLKRSYEVNTHGLQHFLDAVVEHVPAARVFYAASSHVFGNPTQSPQNESTPFDPKTPYALSKVAGIELCRSYRRQHSTFASVGILYNHESPLRAEKFISKKIARSAVQIFRGRLDSLILGSLSSKVDWGYAPDYTRAATLTLQAPAPSDYVISSGELHSVQDMVQSAFEHLGLDWTRYVSESNAVVIRPGYELVGDSSRIRKLGWRPSLSFQEMVRRLVDAENT